MTSDKMQKTGSIMNFELECFILICLMLLLILRDSEDGNIIYIQL